MDTPLPATVFEFQRDNQWLHELRIASLDRPLAFSINTEGIVFSNDVGASPEQE